MDTDGHGFRELRLLGAEFGSDGGEAGLDNSEDQNLKPQMDLNERR
jgi:hypothetical protein